MTVEPRENLMKSNNLTDTYLICFASVLLAVMLAIYISHFLKDYGTTPNRNSSEGCGHGEDDLGRNENQECNSDMEDIELNETYDDLNYEEMETNLFRGKMRIRQLESQLTEDQLEEERRVESEQLAAIFELLKQQEVKLKTQEIDEKGLNDQLKLYR